MAYMASMVTHKAFSNEGKRELLSRLARTNPEKRYDLFVRMCRNRGVALKVKEDLESEDEDEDEKEVRVDVV